MHLAYNYEQNRYGVWDKKAYDWYVEGLHCGMGLDVVYQGQIVHTRIEMDEDWYLVGLPHDTELRGMEVANV